MKYYRLWGTPPLPPKFESGTETDPETGSQLRGVDWADLPDIRTKGRDYRSTASTVTDKKTGTDLTVTAADGLGSWEFSLPFEDLDPDSDPEYERLAASSPTGKYSLRRRKKGG
ncbi:hypothetical protein ABW19_dt0204924 [Dactylella cylindrospora]|nr:hypothetical protein ABW19_dt0204924 [Dactylella cylindrospora]